MKITKRLKFPLWNQNQNQNQIFLIPIGLELEPRSCELLVLSTEILPYIDDQYQTKLVNLYARILNNSDCSAEKKEEIQIKMQAFYNQLASSN